MQLKPRAAKQGPASQTAGRQAEQKMQAGRQGQSWSGKARVAELVGRQADNAGRSQLGGATRLQKLP